ncbi:MAG TPA: hypothetical protein VKA97_09895, partial [Pyrinomonadaceae bacterium]|nr:hypothetical protein [Pyrinomonadaceae bacterium]
SLGGGFEQQRAGARVVKDVEYARRVVLSLPPDPAGGGIYVGRDRAELVRIANFQSAPVGCGVRTSWHL